MSYSQPPPNAPQYAAPQYPPPSSEHPVQLFIRRAERQSRLLALFSIPFFLVRIIAGIPVIICLYVMGFIFEFSAWFAQWAILFGGHYPEGMHRFNTGIMRWGVRLQAWIFGLTDSYPGFRLRP